MVAIVGTLVMAAAVMAGSDDDKDTGTPAGDLPPDSDGNPLPDDTIDLVEELAPIETVDLAVAESYPVQYILTVVSGQPHGCYQFDGYDVQRDGNKVIVTVNNNVPADLSAMLCMQVYNTTESTINLGSDFESGETYVIEVNGEVAEEFVAQ